MSNSNRFNHWGIWEQAVMDEIEQEVRCEEQSAAVLARHVCPSCGEIVPVDRDVASFPCYCWEQAEAEYAVADYSPEQ
jgi:hypothetical protein